MFGPVFPLIKFKTEEQAVAIADNCTYGLSSGVISGEIQRAIRVARQLDAGNCTINGTGLYRTHDMPFGGHRKSGLGTEGLYATLDEFTKTKTYVWKQREIMYDCVFVGPALIIFLISVLLPFLMSVILSFTSWNGQTAPEWTGLSNYKLIFSGTDSFGRNLWFTAKYAFMYVAAVNILGLVFAVLLTNKFVKFRNLSVYGKRTCAGVYLAIHI